MIFAPHLSSHLTLVRESSPHYQHADSPESVAPDADAPELDAPDTAAAQNTDAAPTPDTDALEELGFQIVTLAAHIHAATQRLLALIARFDAHRGWALDGQRSCAHWLAARTGIDLGAAREKVRTARALERLPLIRASMGRGELSFSQVRALTRVAEPGSEADLLELARGLPAAQIERMVRAWKLGSRQAEEEREEWRHRERCLSVFPDHDGMVVVRGRLTPEAGALLMRAVEAASDALYRKEYEPGEGKRGEDGSPRDALETEAEARRRRADALALLAERALAAGFGAEDGAPVSGSRAERYQVMLHVDVETLAQDPEEAGRSELEEGTRVSAETSRRLSCDAAVVRVEHDARGSVVGAGKRRRTVSPALRRALEARDRGCRFPGCGLRFTDAHHVKHWADGGETSLANCVLLCRHHHRLVHEGGWSIQWWGEGRPAFFDPRGGVHFEGRWQPPELGADPVGALQAENRARGIEPDWRTLGPRWRRLEDAPDELYFRAMEAVG